MKDAPENPGDFDMILQNAEGDKKQIYFENPEIDVNNAILDELETFADGIRIEGGTGLGGGIIDSQGDHRIAMAFAVAGLRASAGIEILNCQNVATSFPGFVSQATEVGLKIEELSD